MMLVLRLLAVILVVPATYYFVYWFPFPFPRPEHWITSGISWLCAIGAGLFVWVNFTPGHHGALSSTILGALLLGSIGFSAGFFGPLLFLSLFAPDTGATPLPLLGILITGPLGLIVGGIAGFLYWLIRGRFGQFSEPVAVNLHAPIPFPDERGISRKSSAIKGVNRVAIVIVVLAGVIGVMAVMGYHQSMKVRKERLEAQLAFFDRCRDLFPPKSTSIYKCYEKGRRSYLQQHKDSWATTFWPELGR